MATAVPKEPLRALFASLSGVPKSRVFWSGDAEGSIGPIGGKAAKLTLNVTARATNGRLEPRREFEPTASEAWGAQRVLTISVRADNFLNAGEAFDTLEEVRFRLEMPSARKALRDAGLAFVDAPSIATVGYKIDNREISSATLDVRVAQVVEIESSSEDAATWIEKVTYKSSAQVPDVSAAPYVDLRLTRDNPMPWVAKGRATVSKLRAYARRVTSGISAATSTATVAPELFVLFSSTGLASIALGWVRVKRSSLSSAGLGGISVSYVREKLVSLGSAGTSSTSLSYTVLATPTLSSLSADLGDTLGGESVVITGTRFTSVTAVKFGTTNATSFTVNSSTQITAVAPAHAAGVVDVSVTNGSGTGTLSSSYEFWDPTVLAPRFFWDKGDYTLASGGAWPYRYRDPALSALTGTWSETANYPDVATGNYPSYIRANSDVLNLSNHNIQTILGTSDCTMAIIFDTVDISTTNALSYKNEALLLDSSAFAGMLLGDTTQDKCMFFYWDGAEKTAKLTLSTVAGRHVAVGRKTSGTLTITGDGSSFVTGSTGVGALAGHGSDMRLGRNNYPGMPVPTSVNGKIRAVILDNKSWSTSDLTKFYKWAAARHP